eukprot:SAG22_NODE_122_length_18920_cov_23.494076_18_plen_248_part_00
MGGRRKHSWQLRCAAEHCVNLRGGSQRLPPGSAATPVSPPGRHCQSAGYLAPGLLDLLGAELWVPTSPSEPSPQRPSPRAWRRAVHAPPRGRRGPGASGGRARAQELGQRREEGMRTCLLIMVRSTRGVRSIRAAIVVGFVCWGRLEEPALICLPIGQEVVYTVHTSRARLFARPKAKSCEAERVAGAPARRHDGRHGPDRRLLQRPGGAVHGLPLPRRAGRLRAGHPGVLGPVVQCNFCAQAALGR